MATRSLRAIAAAALAAALLVASHSPAAAQGPVLEGSLLTADGRERSYILYVPTGYDAAAPAPLVLVLHGFSQDATEMVRWGWVEAAEAHGFVVAAPNGTPQRANARAWAAGGREDPNDVDDVGFLLQLIDQLAADYTTDPARVYAAGFSAGGNLLFRLACEAPGRLAAIAPVAAGPQGGRHEPQRFGCLPATGPSIVYLHGTGDAITRPEGAVRAVENWATWLGCAATPQVETGGAVATRTYAGCRGGAGVVVHSIEGGTHAWPGAGRAGDPINAVAATPLLWEFFQAHPLPAASTSQVASTASASIRSTDMMPAV